MVLLLLYESAFRESALRESAFRESAWTMLLNPPQRNQRFRNSTSVKSGKLCYFYFTKAPFAKVHSRRSAFRESAFRESAFRESALSQKRLSRNCTLAEAPFAKAPFTKAPLAKAPFAKAPQRIRSSERGSIPLSHRLCRAETGNPPPSVEGIM